jgi:hypothetical protein
VKIGAHWRWIVSVAQKKLFAPAPAGSGLAAEDSARTRGIAGATLTATAMVGAILANARHECN